MAEAIVPQPRLVDRNVVMTPRNIAAAITQAGDPTFVDGTMLSTDLRRKLDEITNPPDPTVPQQYVAQSVPTVLARQAENIFMQIQGDQNPLNRFDNYTYHVKFSLIDQNQAGAVTSTTNLSALNQIIIAESGATAGFNITKFCIDTTVSPGFQHHNQNVMKWRMTITEPYGLTLPDYIIAAARRLNIRNVDRFFYFIEVWFNGYNDDGTIAADKVCRKVWRVLMLDMDLAASHVGTTYECSGTALDDLGTTNQFALTPAKLNLDGVKTLKDAISKLETAVNKAAKEASNSKVSTTYKIKIPKEMESWQIVGSNSAKDSNRQGSMFGLASSNNGNEITINRGQDIGNFMMYMISKCGKEADAFLRGTNGLGSIPSMEKNGLGNVVQVVPEVQYGNYNGMLNDYEKTITYRVVPFITPRIVSDPEQAKRLEQLGLQQAKISYLIGQQMLNKRYDYIYTGKNTEVLRFDIHVEKFWAVYMEGYLGGQGYSQITAGPLAATNSQGFRENLGYGQAYKLAENVAAQIKEIDKLISSLGSGGGVGSAVNEISNLLGGTGTAINQIAASSSNFNDIINKNLANLGPGGINSVVSQLTNVSNQFSKLATLTTNPITMFDGTNPSTVQQIAASSANIVSLIGQANQLLQAANPANSFRGGLYLEDIKTAVESDDELKVAFLVDTEPKRQNATVNGSEHKNDVSAVTSSGGRPPGASLFGQVLANLYDKHFFQKIELEIRGDPWWFGLTNIESNEAAEIVVGQYGPNPLTNSSGLIDQTANYLKGEHMFLLSFKTGSNYDENTGFMRFNSDGDYFNGFYCVQEVEHRFENGRFTQVLKAYKEPFSQKAGKQATPKVDSGVPTNPPAQLPSIGPIPMTDNGPTFAPGA